MAKEKQLPWYKRVANFDPLKDAQGEVQYTFFIDEYLGDPKKTDAERAADPRVGKNEVRVKREGRAGALSFKSAEDMLKVAEYLVKIAKKQIQSKAYTAPVVTVKPEAAEYKTDW